MEFRRTGLFGNAMSVHLPTDYTDVSKIRQVPDHQEVYLSSNGYSSIQFDINERVDEPGVEDALKYHLEDMVDSGDGIKVWQTSNTAMARFPRETPTSTLLATIHPGKGSANPNRSDFTALLVILIRLEREKTDILVAINIPHIPGHYDPSEIDLEGGDAGKLIRDGFAMRDEILRSLEVLRWELFRP